MLVFNFLIAFVAVGALTSLTYNFWWLLKYILYFRKWSPLNKMIAIHLFSIKLNCPCSEKWNCPSVIIIYVYECVMGIKNNNYLLF